jgi:hypothetical protein
MQYPILKGPDMAKTPKNESYWRDSFSVTEEEDLALQTHFEAEGAPMSLNEIAHFMVQQQLADEAVANAGQYDPQDRYEVGQKLTFPALKGIVGEVTGVRPGNNPRYGDFEVIAVRFGGQSAIREFVAGSQSIRLSGGDSQIAQRLSEAEIFAQYGDSIEETTLAALEDSGEYVTNGREWLPRALVLPFHEGHLNIAEAMVDMVGSPLTPEELLPELDIASTLPEAIKRFSLNYTLMQDNRFKNVGSDTEPRWDLNK